MWFQGATLLISGPLHQHSLWPLEGKKRSGSKQDGFAICHEMLYICMVVLWFFSVDAKRTGMKKAWLFFLLACLENHSISQKRIWVCHCHFAETLCQDLSLWYIGPIISICLVMFVPLLSLALRQVLFLCTCNQLDTIDRPLLDRMEAQSLILICVYHRKYTKNQKGNPEFFLVRPEDRMNFKYSIYCICVSYCRCSIMHWGRDPLEFCGWDHWTLRLHYGGQGGNNKLSLQVVFAKTLMNSVRLQYI